MTDTIKTDYDEAIDVLSEVLHYDEENLTVYEEGLLEDFEWHCGASKVAIILEDCVLKTSYSGYVYYDADEGEDEIINDFLDYAKMEYQLYQAAKEYNVDYFLAKTEEVAPAVYEQEKMDYVADTITELDASEVLKIIPFNYTFHTSYGKQTLPPQLVLNCTGLHKYCKMNCLEDLIERVKPDILGYFLASYTQSELDDLQQFLKDYDINDIRAGNCGWVNGKLKIFDFCGFKSETEKILKK